MITPIPPLEILLSLDLDDAALERLEEQAWQALDAAKGYDRASFVIGYQTGLLAALGAFREQLIERGATMPKQPLP